MLNFHHLAHCAPASAYVSQLVRSCSFVLHASVTTEDAAHLTFTVSFHDFCHTVCQKLTLLLVVPSVANKLHAKLW